MALANKVLCSCVSTHKTMKKQDYKTMNEKTRLPKLNNKDAITEQKQQNHQSSRISGVSKASDNRCVTTDS